MSGPVVGVTSNDGFSATMLDSRRRWARLWESAIFGDPRYRYWGWIAVGNCRELLRGDSGVKQVRSLIDRPDFNTIVGGIGYFCFVATSNVAVSYSKLDRSRGTVELEEDVPEASKGML